MDAFTPFVVGLAGVGVAGFVAWTIGSIIKAKADIAALRLHVAENYAPNIDIHQMQGQLEKLGNKVDSMLEMLHKINARQEASHQ